MTAVKMIALILSLGVDTLIVSISLGVMKTVGKVRIAITFACAEALMPLVGLFIGRGASRIIGHAASLAGGLALLCVAAWLIFFDDDDDTSVSERTRTLAGWALIGTALSISIDELAVGFSIGLIGVPVILTILLVAAQALVFTWLGLTFGARLKPFVGEWAEKAAGIVLGLLGLWLAIEAVSRLIHG